MTYIIQLDAAWRKLYRTLRYICEQYGRTSEPARQVGDKMNEVRAELVSLGQKTLLASTELRDEII
jgi:hypothetical protein